GGERAKCCVARSRRLLIGLGACTSRDDQRGKKSANGTRFHRETTLYGNWGGGIRFFVACSKAKARAISLGSLHAVPVNVTLNGAGFGSKPAGNANAPVPGG